MGRSRARAWLVAAVVAALAAGAGCEPEAQPAREAATPPAEADLTPAPTPPGEPDPGEETPPSPGPSPEEAETPATSGAFAVSAGHPAAVDVGMEVLARDGVPAPAIVAAQLRSAGHRLPTGDLPHLYTDGTALEGGEALVQEELATTLDHLAEAGARSFYEGDLAAVLSERVDGIDTDSLASYEVQRAAPASGAFAGLEVLAAAPPLPGATVVQTLQVAEALGVAEHEPGSADFIHAIVTGWRLAEHVLRWEVGDPAFVEVPLEGMTDPERNAELAALVPMAAVPGIDAGRRDGGVGANTTHVTVVDGDGTVVSMTNTLTNFWGSGDYELGFFLNDQLRRFDIGRGDANEPAPGKRSVSWAAPVVVLDAEGRAVLCLGSPGGGGSRSCWPR